MTKREQALEAFQGVTRRLKSLLNISSGNSGHSATASRSDFLSALSKVNKEMTRFIDSVTLYKEMKFKSVPSGVVLKNSVPVTLEAVDVPGVRFEELKERDDIQKDILPIFFEEVDELLPIIEDLFVKLKSGDFSTEVISSLHRHLHTLKGSAGMAGLIRVRSIVHVMEGIMEEAESHSTIGRAVVDDLVQRFNLSRKLIEEVSDVKDIKGAVSTNIIEQPLSAEIDNEILGVYPELQERDDVQKDILPIFFEEVDELLPVIDDLFTELTSGSRSSEVISSLHRHLHTLKGSAGMAGLLRVRSLIHVLESIMEGAESGSEITPADLALMSTRFNLSKNVIAAVKEGDFNWLPKIRQKTEVAVVNETEKAKSKSSASRVVRLRSEVIDVLVQETNEVVLSRSGLDNTVNNARNVNAALEESLKSLFKLVKDLEIQAEAQIQSRVSMAATEGVDFDPLEFDRFTELQEMTRSLNERVNDAFESQQNMEHILEQQDALLASQGNSILDIQSRLIKTRLAPFGMLEGRFQRIVEQTAKEVNKQATLVINGGMTEVDAQVLEKITSPIEHTLRNSLAHGIESIEKRTELGKKECGTISISVRAEAGKVTIEIKDDGCGINIPKVQEKAIEKGLWKAGHKMSPAQAAEMICLPSFSTASEVSQISGRGVGMDVVKNEVLELGGKFYLSSESGIGLTTIFQLPTALSTSSALLVMDGNDRFFIDTDCIEKIIMVTKEELISAYDNQTINCDINGVNQKVDFLLLTDLYKIAGVSLKKNQVKEFTQVLILRDRENLVAVYVPKVMNESLISIKPVGKLWNNIPGLNGTAIMPDGAAVFVTNPALTYAELKRKNGLIDKNVEAVEVQVKTRVLVVDDSLTVRKATSRLLVRSNMEPILAKNGQNGVEILNTLDVLPDIILLDVEMPKMDGFEFAKYVRETEKFKNIPIIMITSRTADKHRNRALSIGVNEYIGKPFQEEMLLGLIRRYTEIDNSFSK